MRPPSVESVLEGQGQRRSTPPISADEPGAMTKKMGPDDLRRIFRQYDEDGSGEITGHELQTVLVSLMGKLPSDEAVRGILEDIDADGSGSIDEDEFLEFFARIENLHQLQAQLQMMGKKSGFQRRIAIIYVAVNFFAFCVSCLLHLNSEPGTLKGRLAHIALMVSASSLGLVFCLGLLGPIIQYKCGERMQPLLQKAAQKVNPRGILERRRAVVLEIQENRIVLTKEQALAKQADEAHENLPRPPGHPTFAPPRPPDTGLPETPASYESYRKSKRMEAWSSGPGSSMFSDWPAQPSTPSSPKANKPLTPSIVKVSNSNFTGYNVNNYLRAREIMASTGQRSFTPVAMSKADRTPWFSTQAAEQISEVQPDLWVDGARSSPATTNALPSPTVRDIPVHASHLHLESQALALRDALPANRAAIIVKELH